MSKKRKTAEGTAKALTILGNTAQIESGGLLQKTSVDVAKFDVALKKWSKTKAGSPWASWAGRNCLAKMPK